MRSRGCVLVSRPKQTTATTGMRLNNRPRQKRIQTPNIDRLAKDGLRFTDFYAGCTVCAPSRCALMTGLHTGHTRVRGNDRVPLEPGDVTVAEVLHARGYRTALTAAGIKVDSQPLALRSFPQKRA